MFENEETMATATEVSEATPDNETLESEQTDTTEAETTATPEAKLKLNFMGEEKEITLDEARTLAQKGLNHDRLQEKWESSKSTLNAFEEIARKAGFVDVHGHGDIEAYKTAANEQLKQREIDEITQGTQLPPELAEELYLSRKDRAERQAEIDKQKSEQVRNEQFSELLSFYKEVHGKDFDPATTKLPEEIFIAMEKGIPPKYAYAEYVTRQSLAEKAIEKQNEENSSASVGSVTGTGATIEREFFNNDELDKLSAKDLEDPSILKKALKSLSRLGS